MHNSDYIINQYKAKLLDHGFQGEFHVDYPTLLLNATDNSIYELMPQAVAQPLNTQDLQILIQIANFDEFKSLCFAARGGGTGTNGQSLTKHIVIDFSRFMTRILDFNQFDKTIIVESGVILSDLNRYLKPYGLFFAPHVSTGDRATIGGMIATDAAGKGSLIYGKTSDHIISTELILVDGTILNTDKIPLDKLDCFASTRNNDIDTNNNSIIDAGNNIIGTINDGIVTIINKPNSLQKQAENEYTHSVTKNSHCEQKRSNFIKQIINLLDPVQDEIDLRFPPLKRPLSGYNIKQCYQNDEIDLNRLIAGSEGTLGLVATAKLSLLPIPQYNTLIVIHYSTFQAALRDAENLIKHQPLAIEAIDEKVQKSAQTLPNWPTLSKWLNSEGKNYISNFVEFVADTEVELQQKIANLEQDLNKHNTNYVVITDASQINQLWSIRSLAVGLAGKIPGASKPVAFIEDAIVPPEHLADFVADLEQILDERKLNYAMYGHVDVGCIHVRPALNMQDESNRQMVRPITDEVIKLLNKYHGVLWGEHGKGFRGEFVPDVFGSVLYDVLCKIKAIFDPYNRLNPGKLAIPEMDLTASNFKTVKNQQDFIKITDVQNKNADIMPAQSRTLQLDKIDKVPMRGQFDQVIGQELQQKFSDSILCNGNAACFNKEPSNVMCPSYKVTGDRIHSPKGRAMLTKEWLREQAKGDGKDHKVADMVFDAMNGCLGCKGCSGKCPTGVSIPDLRTKFLDEYYKKYRKRKFGELLSGYIEHLLPLIAKFPKTWNFLNHNRLIPTFGMSNLPIFSSAKPLKQVLREQNVTVYDNPNEVGKLAVNAVVVFTDAFTGFLDTDILVATINVLKQLGYVPYVMYPQASGKALIVGGFISPFKQNTIKLNQWFEPLFAANIPVVGLENSVVLMFRDEVHKFADTPFSGRVQTLAEFISGNYERSVVISATERQQKYILLPHCTEQSILPAEAILWQKIYDKIGLELEVRNLGCCGMAGTYGYQKQQQQNSQKLFAMHWQKNIIDEDTNSDQIQILATGFSCRAQSQKQINKKILHPIEILSCRITSL
jgi:FAD/FMN-containing dehydrogenase/Fe-S oxidoreductase